MRPPVGPADREQPERLSELLSDLSGAPRADTRLSRMRMRAIGYAERATTWGPIAPFAELGWRVFRRDQSIAGSVLAAALAYRLFVWVLPLALLLVNGLHLYASSQERTTAGVAEDAGFGGFLAESVGEAADAPGLLARIVLVVGATLVLMYETYVLLRALRAVSSFAWRIPVRPMHRPPVQTLALLGVLLGTAAVAGLFNAARDLGEPVGLIVWCASLAVPPLGAFLLFALLLPSGADHWSEHLPGAVLFSVLLWGIGVFNSLVLVPWLLRKQETYGVLGLAAGLLLSLFIAGRSVEFSVALNAVLHDERKAARASRPEVA